MTKGLKKKKSPFSLFHDISVAQTRCRAMDACTTPQALGALFDLSRSLFE